MTSLIEGSKPELQPDDATIPPRAACACDPATCLQRLLHGRCCQELAAVETETQDPSEEPQGTESADRQV
jgi:hypothetical protein